mgnify:CR=1 FL=1
MGNLAPHRAPGTCSIDIPQVALLFAQGVDVGLGVLGGFATVFGRKREREGPEPRVVIGESLILTLTLTLDLPLSSRPS